MKEFTSEASEAPKEAQIEPNINVEAPHLPV
jgi:hypothetical protein